MFTASVPNGKSRPTRPATAPSSRKRAIAPTPPTSPCRAAPRQLIRHLRAADDVGGDRDGEKAAATLASAYVSASAEVLLVEHLKSSICIVENVVNAPQMPGAEKRPAIRRQRQALLQTGGEIAERERSDDVHRERRPGHSRGVAGSASATSARAIAPMKPPAKIAASSRRSIRMSEPHRWPTRRIGVLNRAVRLGAIGSERGGLHSDHLLRSLAGNAQRPSAAMPRLWSEPHRSGGSYQPRDMGCGPSTPLARVSTHAAPARAVAVTTPERDRPR